MIETKKGGLLQNSPFSLYNKRRLEDDFQSAFYIREKDSDTALLLFLAHFIRETRNGREGIIVITEPVGQVLVNVFYKTG